MHGSEMGCILDGSSLQTLRLFPPSAPAGSRNLCQQTHFLAQHFVALLQAAPLCLLTCSGKLRLGLADTFWSGCSRAAEWSFLARKVSLNQV